MRDHHEWTAFRHAVFGALFLVAFSGFAKEPRWYERPGMPITLASSGFVFSAMLPHDWSFKAERGFVPPAQLASSCRVRSAFHSDRDWNRFLASALRSTDGLNAADDARIILKIGGHPAVSDRYVRGSVMVRNVYIDLSDLRPDSGAVWTFEGDATDEGTDCELQFLALIHSARITRAGATGH